MADLWTLSELVEEVARRIAALPAPKNGQVRAVPDERTIRYYGTIGLLDRPAGARGRTALYGPRHLAQIIAIKRLQTMGRSLAEIQTAWPTLDDVALQRMSGVALAEAPRTARPAFWKTAASEVATAPAPARPHAPTPRAPSPAAAELRIELAPTIHLTLAVPATGIALSHADLEAIHAAAAPLVAELLGRIETP